MSALVTGMLTDKRNAEEKAETAKRNAEEEAEIAKRNAEEKAEATISVSLMYYMVFTVSRSNL